MNTKIFMMLLSVLSLNVQASDIVLEGERWLADSTGYKCGAFEESVEATPMLASMNTKFERLSTDYSLDNALVKATFTENGETCRYSALLFADNAAGTIEYVDSKAYAVDSDAKCDNGKEILDQMFSFSKYLYWGHPHHVTIMVSDRTAASICDGKEKIGIDFTLSGIIR